MISTDEVDESQVKDLTLDKRLTKCIIAKRDIKEGSLSRKNRIAKAKDVGLMLKYMLDMNE